MMRRCMLLVVLLGCGLVRTAEGKDLGIQLAENPPMQMIFREPPKPAGIAGTFEIREGFTVIGTLDEFRVAIKKDNQNIRVKPGVYRAEKIDPPMDNQEHIFAVNGSDNYFDLRGVVFETPVSVQSRLSGRAHVADTWHINGTGNTFEGGYFRNVVDKDYPNYRVTENEFEVCNDNNTFLDCTFVIKGSVPYGYTDYYGKGGPNFGRLNKHSFMSISRARNTKLIGCEVYMQSFGHCVHFHGADGVLIKDCLFTGALRPTNDIFLEKAGRATEYDFNIMYRGKRPIPRDQMIPLPEDGVRSYGGDKNIAVIDTTVERLRGCFQLLCDGDVTLENVTVLEAGDFSYDLSSGGKGKVVMKNCRGDFAYNPLFNLTRGDVPKDSFYEITILSPAEGAQATARTSLGTICGEECTFIFHDGTTRPIPEGVNRLICGGKKDLKNSAVVNYTAARLILNERVRNCVIKSVGPVEDNGEGNTVMKIKPEKSRLRAVEGGLEAFMGEAKFDVRQVYDRDRFPNIAVATDGTVLAFWQGVKVRRSEDGGETWGPEIMVGKGFMGGGVIVNEVNGEILAFVEEHHPPAALRVYRSGDHGKSWSATEVKIRPDTNGNVPSMHMNEAGITLRHGEHAGRIVRAARHYAGKNDRSKWPEHYTTAIYSDDGGRTWNTSKPFAEMGTGEAAIAELSDGRFYYNSRAHWNEDKPPLRRRCAWSDDGGETWSGWRIVEVLPDGPQNTNYGCMGGLVRLPVRGRDILIYSNCDSPDGRRLGTVWASFDGGETWPLKRLVQEGSFAYSSLSAGRPGTKSEGWVYLLFESGGAKVARFNLNWVLGGEKTGDGEVPRWVLR